MGNDLLDRLLDRLIRAELGARGKLLVLLPMRYGGLQCMQDGTLPKVALRCSRAGRLVLPKAAT